MPRSLVLRCARLRRWPTHRSRSTSSTARTSCSATTSRSLHTSTPTAWRSPRCAACSARCSGCSSRGRRTSAWPPTTSSSRSATTSGSGTRRARAWTPSCWPSSRCSRTASGRSASPSGPWSSSRPTTRWRRPRGVARDDDRVERVFICTPDKDLGQCVEDPTVVQLDRRQGGQLLDEAAVRERFGVGPRSIPDYLALVGDSADGFPGLPGWGAKSTATVLARYEHLDGDPRRRDGVGRSTCAARRSWRRRWPKRAKRPSSSSISRRCAPTPTSGTVDDWEWRGRDAGARCVGEAARRREPRGPRRAAGRGSGSADGGARAHGRSVPVHARSPTARATASSCCCCTASRRRRTSGAHQVATLGAAGYRAVAPDQRGYARGARPGDRRRVPRRAPRRRRRRASPTRSAPTGSTSSATTGAASWPGTPRRRIRRAAAHAHRRVHAAPDAVPGRDAPAAATSASARATCSGSGRPTRKRRSSPTTPRCSRAAYADHPPDAAAEYLRVFTADGGAALTGGLNWYRANDFRAPDRADHRADAVRVVDRRRRARAGGGRGHRGRGRRARTGSRCSRT